MKRRNRSSMYSVLSSPLTLIASLIIFILLARAAWSIHEKNRESILRLQVAQSELTKLEDSRSELQGRVDQLSTPAGVKAQIKERYHAVEPGESVAVIVDGGANATGTASAADAAPVYAPAGWWQKLLSIFKRD